MAEKKADPVLSPEQTSNGGGNRMMLIVGIIIFVVIGAGAAAFMLSKRQAQPPAKVQYETPTEAPTPTIPPEEAAITSGAEEDIDRIEIETPDADITDVQKDVDQL